MDVNIAGNLRLKAERDARGEDSGVPVGALLLGCGNCTKSRLPDGSPLYCAVCPVTYRRAEKAGITRGELFRREASIVSAGASVPPLAGPSSQAQPAGTTFGLLDG